MSNQIIIQVFSIRYKMVGFNVTKLSKIIDITTRSKQELFLQYKIRKNSFHSFIKKPFKYKKIWHEFIIETLQGCYSTYTDYIYKIEERKLKTFKLLLLGVSMFFTGFIGFAILIGSVMASNFTLNSSNYFVDTWRLYGVTPIAIGFF